MRARSGLLCLWTALTFVTARAAPLHVELSAPAPTLSLGVAVPAPAPAPAPSFGGVLLAPSPAALPVAADRVATAEAPADAESAGASSADYFDGKVDALSEDEILPLLSVGFRPDDEFRRWTAPGGTNYLLNSEVNANRAAGRAGRLSRTLLRLAVPEVGQKTLIERNRDVIPREVAGELKRNDNLPGPILRRRLASLMRRRLALFVQAPPAAVAPLHDADERRLGDAIQSAWVKRMQQTREGEILLSSLTGDPSVPLPTIRVVRMLRLAGGVQTIYGNQILLSLEDLRRKLTERIPAERRPEFLREFHDEVSAARYVDAHPELAVDAAEVVQTTLFHEHVHHWQSATRVYAQYTARNILPTVSTVESEYEAIFRQNVLVAEMLSSSDATIGIDRLGEFVELISDVHHWRSKIKNTYLVVNQHLYVDLSRLLGLYEYALNVAEGLGRKSSSPIVAQNLQLMRQGRGVLAEEMRAAEVLQRRIDVELPAMATQGLVRWAELSEREGRWIEAATAYHLLAEKNTDDQDNRWAARREEALARAWSTLIDRDGRLHEREPLDFRIRQINALVNFFNRTNRPWPFQVWEARKKDFPLYAASLRDQTTTGDPSGAADLRRVADNYENVAKGDLKALRGHADVQLGVLTSSPDRARRDAAFTAGIRFATILGDADLIRAFTERKPVGLFK